MNVVEAYDLSSALAIAGTNHVIPQGAGVEVRPVPSGGQVREPSA